MSHRYYTDYVHEEFRSPIPHTIPNFSGAWILIEPVCFDQFLASASLGSRASTDVSEALLIATKAILETNPFSYSDVAIGCSGRVAIFMRHQFDTYFQTPQQIATGAASFMTGAFDRALTEPMLNFPIWQVSMFTCTLSNQGGTAPGRHIPFYDNVKEMLAAIALNRDQVKSASFWELMRREDSSLHGTFTTVDTLDDRD